MGAGVSEVVAWIVAVGGVIGTLIAAYAAYRKTNSETDIEKRKVVMDEERLCDARELSAYEKAAQANDRLVKELEGRVKSLEESLREVLGELKTSQAAHIKCELAMERANGKIGIMQVQLDRLMAHDAANKQQIEQVKAAVEEAKP